MDRLPGSGLWRVVVIALVVLLLAACTSGSDPTTTTVPGDEPTTTTTVPGDTTTTTPPGSTAIPGDASPSIAPEVVELMRSQIAELLTVTEEVRGLPFLETPTVTILDEQDFADRVAALIAEELDDEEMAVDARVLILLGMLDPGTDLRAFLIDLYTEQVAGFYDGDTRELVVPAALEGFTPMQRLTVVHELIHALTDQHFEFIDRHTELSESGNGDDLAALLALIEGDATYFQFVYLEQLPPMEALEIAMEALSIDRTVLDAAPDWLVADLTFPYESGLTFVGALVSEGGIAAVDKAYIDPPWTTAQILDPVRFIRGQGARELPPLEVSVPGWEVHDEGTWGEWGLRLFFMDTLSAGMNTQTASGWGNDHYAALSRGDDVAFVLHYVGETELDTEEVTNAFISMARGAMGASGGVESGGGLLFSDPYVFIDRIDSELYFIASTDAAAGAEIRTQLGL